MLAFDCEDLPVNNNKEETISLKKSSSNGVLNQSLSNNPSGLGLASSVVAATGGSSLAVSGEQSDQATVPLNGDRNSKQIDESQPQQQQQQQSNGNLIRSQFEQKTKYLRDLFTQHGVIKLNKDHTQLLVIILLSLIAIACSIAALTSNNWTCDSNSPSSSSRFGLWNTCYLPINDNTNLSTGDALLDQDFSSNSSSLNVTPSSIIKTGVLCAQQGLYEIKIELAQQSRIDQVSASQGLIVSGTILYVFSVVSIVLAYKFIHVNNLNSVRNALVTSMCVQIISFFMQLIGFFLFVLTDRLSTSVGLLFVYFGLAIFATNIINFITIEYKSYKTRQISI